MEGSLYDIVWVAYGFDSFDKDKVQLKPRNLRWEASINKPSTGIWASPVDSAFGWSDFLKGEHWRTSTLGQHYLFRLSPDANIYVIDTLDKLVAISDKASYDKPCINVDKLMANYDGVFVTDEMAGRYHCDYSIRVADLNSWDCESICIWNKEVIDVIPEEEIERIMFNLKKENYYSKQKDDDGYEEELRDTKRDFEERFYNRNVNDNQPFSVHPAILAQGDDNDKMTSLSRRYNGTVDSVMEGCLRRIVRESLRNFRVL